MRVGFIGREQMRSAIAANLLAAGHEYARLKLGSVRASVTR